MAQFKTTWSSGKTEVVEQSDCCTVEQYVNCRFGKGFDTQEHGVKVEMLSEVVDTKLEPKPKSKAKK